MNIKQVETMTGITKQNIRFYEKKGLIAPGRNMDNDYREYGEEEIRRLKIVKVLRKMGMPLEDIREVLEEKIPFSEAVHVQSQKLEQEKQNVEAALRLCKQLEPKTIQTIDADRVLAWIGEEEKRGSVFADAWEEWKEVVHTEWQKSFSFMPDTMIQSPKEFTEELFRYAAQNQMDITITKESMYPEFTLDGVEYCADRRIGRMGAVVVCEMLSPELEEPEGVPAKRKKAMKIAARCLPVLILFLAFLILCMDRMYKEELFVQVLCAAALTSFVAAAGGLYWKLKP